MIYKVLILNDIYELLICVEISKHFEMNKASCFVNKILLYLSQFSASNESVQKHEKCIS